MNDLYPHAKRFGMGESLEPPDCFMAGIEDVFQAMRALDFSPWRLEAVAEHLGLSNEAREWVGLEPTTKP